MIETPNTDPSPAEKPKVALCYRKKFVYITLLVIAPFSPIAFPFLWLSPQFSKKEKIWVTIGTIVACVILGVITYKSYSALQDVLKNYKDAGLI